MSPDQLAAFFIFATIASITPGPNNMMVLSSGLNFGFARSLPHIAGIGAGFALMVFATGLGLHAVFVEVPVLQTILKYLGAAYLLWLAWQLAHSAPPDTDAAALRRPMRFIGAAAFQWVNPKAWVMAVGALTIYLPASARIVDTAILALVFGAISALCVSLRTIFGAAMRRVLQQPRYVRVFNIGTALLLVTSLYPMLT